MSIARFLLMCAAIAALQAGCAVRAADNPDSIAISGEPRVSEQRVRPIPVEEMTAQHKQLLGIVDGKPLPKRAQSNLFRILMHNPDLMEVYAPMGDMVSRAPQIPVKQRELVILRVVWLYQSRNEWARHHVKALNAGWTRDDIEQIKIGARAAGWSKFDRALLKAADQLVRNAYLEDDVWATLREVYSVHDMMLLITLVSHYHWVAMMTKSLEGEPAFEVQAFVAAGEPLVHEGSVAFVEGPATRSDGVIFFTDIPNNRIMRRELSGAITTHRENANHANGLVFDRQDNLIIAETDGHIVSESSSGEITILAKQFNGSAFNSPNDLTLDTKDRVYFTDPANRNRQKASQRDNEGEIVDGIYRIDSPGNVTRILTHEVDRPNGILVSPNDQYLYVAENNNRANGARQLVRFDLDANGNVAIDSKKVLFDWGTERGPDGMTIDTLGNIYVAAGILHPKPHRTSLKYKAGIYVISPQGDLLNFIAIPMDQVSNVTFGGDDYKTLFVTAGHSLWSYKVTTPGYKPF